MACHECEQRRIQMALMAQAGAEWTKNPFGPGIGDILLKLRLEAIARGELDAIKPSQD